MKQLEFWRDKAITSKLKALALLVYHYLSFVMIFIAIGVFIGVTLTKCLVDWKVREAIQVGGFYYQGKVYDVKERLK